MSQCCAKSKRSGERCRRRAVSGATVCQMHGGKNSGRPIVHGRYSLKHQASLQAKQSEFLSDPSPGDLSGELALMRTLLQDYLERIEGPVSIENIQQIYRMLESVGRQVERISKVLSTTALTQAEVKLLQAQLAHLSVKYVDPARRAEFYEELQSCFNGGRHLSAGAGD